MQKPHYLLHHYPLDPFSRSVRLAMAEKGVSFELVLERPWAPRPDYLAINPSGAVPSLVVQFIATEEPPLVVSSSYAVYEFLEETLSEMTLLGKLPDCRAEVRRLVSWFDDKMYHEVTEHLLVEKAFKRLNAGGEPDTARIHAAYHNVQGHLGYIAWLTEQRNWLAGDQITYADLAAAAQLSVVDYFGDVPWHKHQEAKNWYARIKSRPSFRAILSDYIGGLVPSENYANLDF